VFPFKRRVLRAARLCQPEVVIVLATILAAIAFSPFLVLAHAGTTAIR
jgi:hypothetical protein